MRRQRDSFAAPHFKKVRADDAARAWLLREEIGLPERRRSLHRQRLTLPPAAARRSRLLFAVAFDLDLRGCHGPFGHRYGVGRFACALRPLDPLMVRSGLGGRAPTPILLRTGFALG